MAMSRQVNSSSIVACSPGDEPSCPKVQHQQRAGLAGFNKLGGTLNGRRGCSDRLSTALLGPCMFLLAGNSVSPITTRMRTVTMPQGFKYLVVQLWHSGRLINRRFLIHSQVKLTGAVYLRPMPLTTLIGMLKCPLSAPTTMLWALHADPFGSHRTTMAQPPAFCAHRRDLQPWSQRSS